MRARGSGSPRNLAILGALLALAAIPVACAQGLVLSETGPTGMGGGGTTTSSVTTTVVSVGTTSGGGFGGSGGSSTSSGGSGGSPADVTSSSVATTSSVSSSSGGPSSQCDGAASSGSCDDCSECANCSICVNEASDCEFDCACFGILLCISCCAPSDVVCEEDCITENPGGEQLFNAYNTCLGCACQENCQVPAADCQ